MSEPTAIGKGSTFWQTMFNAWMKLVDGEIRKAVGVVSADLPDICYADLFDQGTTPREAAAEAIKFAQEV